MPHGFKCDRCGEFVEDSQGKIEESLAIIQENDVHTETVEVSAEVDGDTNLHSYTLCPDCRGELVRFVEEEGHA